MKIHVEVWIAANILAKKQTTFSKKQLMDTIEREFNDIRSGISTHISSYCVASSKANPGKYRYLTRVSPGEYRLFEKGDETHITKKNAPLQPREDEIPEKYHYLILGKKEIFEFRIQHVINKNESILYDYQKEGIQRILEAVYSKNNILLSIATGLGRNYIVSRALKTLFKKGIIKNALILTSRKVLLDQFSNVLTENHIDNYRITPNLLNSKLLKKNSVYLTTVQQYNKWSSRLSMIDFDVIIIDECHHLSKDEWALIKQHEAVLIALSATPSSLINDNIFKFLNIKKPILSYGLSPIKLKEIGFC